MRMILLAGASLALTLSACGQADKPTADAATENAAAGPMASQAYSGSGKVTAIDGERVTIAHGPIEGIGWPAMTMSFVALDGLADEVSVGSEIDFSFRQDGGV